MKYHATPTTIDGIRFDSIAEANHYCELKLLERAHMISELRIHPSYTLQEAFEYRGRKERAITYEADFSYKEKGEVIVEDVKGFRTDVYNIKRKLFEYKYPEYIFKEVKV